MKTLAVLALSGAIAASSAALGQALPDGVVFGPKVDAKNDALKAALRRKTEEPVRQRIWVDFARVDAPKAVADFTSVWHQPPVCQGLSGMCWCFSTTSFLESEARRRGKGALSLSALHTVYWEYVEKARGFVRSRGASHFGEGSQPLAVLRALKAHGAVPAAAYTGLSEGRTDHDHGSTVFAELSAYLAGVKAAGAWNEAHVVATVRAILDHHLGAPPETVNVGGRSLTPRGYLAEVVGLDPDDYVALVSTMQKPHGTRTTYDVPDNWWHGAEYLNVSLDAFVGAVKGAIRRGFSVVLAGDISEPGYSIGPPGIAVVPSWDLPSAAIDERARELRFLNGTTTDDHDLHLVGVLTRDGKDWFLVKDSWTSAFNNDHPGYYFFHEDYLKLKVLSVLVHRDAIAGLLERAGG